MKNTDAAVKLKCVCSIYFNYRIISMKFKKNVLEMILVYLLLNQKSLPDIKILNTAKLILHCLKVPLMVSVKDTKLIYVETLQYLKSL